MKCKMKKSCRKHKCLNICCEARSNPLKARDHLCLKVCSKPFSCGKHNCDLFCHLGACGFCPVVINRPLTCACGKESLRPPLSCGT